MRGRALLLGLADALAVLWRLIPGRRGIVTGLMVLDSRGSDPAAGLKRLFATRDTLDFVIAERAMALGRGVHPKHRLTGYHRFFIDRIAATARVLDIGCGIGAVARSIALARPGATVVGIDNDAGRLGEAMAGQRPANLSFVAGDATVAVPEGPWDVLVLSNVLEHIVDRVGFLAALRATSKAPLFLIRVPHFERDWQMAMRRELGVNHHSDPDHKIEHTVEEFGAETAAAGLEVVELLTPWGEIWAALRPSAGGERAG
jgi:SAM-dependent methyltransferase